MNKKVTTTLLSTAMIVSLAVPTAVNANELSDTENIIEQSQEQENNEVLENSENVVQKETEERNQEEFSTENQEDINENETQQEVAAQAIEQPEVETQSLERAVGTTVYLHPVNGSDDKDGTTKDAAVKTLDKAIELAGEGGTIYVGDRIPVNNGATVTLDRNITLKKYEAFENKKSLFAVQSGAHLIINNATIDGAVDHDKVTDTGTVGPNNILSSCVEVQDAKITVNQGAVFKNAWRGIDLVGMNSTTDAIINGGEFYNLGEDTSVTQNSCAIEARTYMENSKVNLTINDVNIHDNKVGSDNSSTIKGAINTYRQMSGDIVVNMNGGTIENNTVRNNAKATAAALTISTGVVFNMNGGTITGNTGNNGGAVYVEGGGVFNVNGGTISNNTGSGNGGGAIYGHNATVTIGDGVSITGNKTTGDNSGGGAIALSGTSSLTVGKATISNNSSQYGGGIASWSKGTVTLNGTTISNNKALSTTGWGNGGGISINNSGTLNVNGATITGNQSLFGGGIGAYNTAKVNIDIASSLKEKTTISNNTVTEIGGAGLYGYGDSVFNIGDGVQITQNHATGNDSGGGAIALANNATLIAGKAILDGNDAQYGGGIASWSTGISQLNGTTITNNKTSTSEDWGNGGGISINKTGTLNIKGAKIEGNKALSGGGIMAFDTAVMNIDDNTSISSNSTLTDTNGGGGVLASGSSTINLNSATISNNTAPYGSAIVVWNNGKAVMKKDVSIMKNKVKSSVKSVDEGTVYVSGSKNGGGQFIMEGGMIRDNTSAGGIHGAGIYVEGYRDIGLVQIKGGTITNNTNENGDDQSIVVRANEDDQGNVYLGKLELSGSPTITGQVLLRKDTSKDIKADVVDEFTPTQPIAVALDNDRWTKQSVIATYASKVTPNKDMFKPYQENERRYIAQNKQDLECMNKVKVTFKNDDGSSNKEVYVMPNGKVKESNAPTLTKTGYIFKYWKNEKDGKEWDFAQNELLKKILL